MGEAQPPGSAQAEQADQNHVKQVVGVVSPIIIMRVIITFIIIMTTDSAEALWW
jgi:hypothetical protein